MASSSLRFLSPYPHFPSPKSPPKPSTRRHIVRLISASATEPPKPKPIREIPGDYGLPLIGPIKDRLDYFYNQGKDVFFKSRITNLRSSRPTCLLAPSSPPTRTWSLTWTARASPPCSTSRRSKRGTSSPGRTCPRQNSPGATDSPLALDPSEFIHPKLKQLMFSLHKSRRENIIPEFHASYTELFDTIEREWESKGKAKKMGISGEEACHNLLCATCFNAFGGMTIFFPSVLKWVGQSGVQLHAQAAQLATEI